MKNDFLWDGAAAANQIKGAWRERGKGWTEDDV